MNIVIIGGGDIGITIAKKLISEKHNVTIIENDEKQIKFLQSNLDALIIHGNGVSLAKLKEANIKNSSLFIAVTNNDTINIVACSLVKRICKKKMIIVSKLENSFFYFDDDIITPLNFGIDMMIDKNKLSIEKILTLIEHPKAIEIVNYSGRQSQLIGLRISKDFKYNGKSLKEIGDNDETLKNVRIVAINRNNEIIIPQGTDIIIPKDEIYMIGRTDLMQKVMKDYFAPKQKLKNIIIIGGTNLGKELSKILIKQGKIVTIIESNSHYCEELSKELKGVNIINGLGTDLIALNEVEIKKSCFICVSRDDEYNMITAAFAKKHNASKAICLINNIELVPITKNMPLIDAVFSPNLIAAAEILRFCRKGNIISITTFSEINAETIGFLVSYKISILDKPLKDVKLPHGIIIGVIIRGKKVIIPTGNDMIKINDKVILFVLPTATKEVEKIFSKRFRL